LEALTALSWLPDAVAVELYTRLHGAPEGSAVQSNEAESG
jgi:hypothetical protein